MRELESALTRIALKQQNKSSRPMNNPMIKQQLNYYIQHQSFIKAIQVVKRFLPISK